MARKGKWAYKPEAWKHMAKRKDYGCMVIIVVFVTLTTLIVCI